MDNLTKKEREIIAKNLEENRRAIQHIIWQMNNPNTKILIPAKARRGGGG